MATKRHDKRTLQRRDGRREDTRKKSCFICAILTDSTAMYWTREKPIGSSPFGGDYALGWMTTERSWGGGKVLNHAGDNTMNFANVWVAPQRDFAILVCVNQSGK